MMNVVKSVFAMAVLAACAHVSASPIVATPDFPVKKTMETVKAEQPAPACQCPTQQVSAAKKTA